MKKVSFILCFASMIFAQQDTLITKQGKIYSGKIVNDDSKYIEFQLENWTSSNKIQRNGIKKLISADGTVLIENNGEAVKNENPLVGKIILDELIIKRGKKNVKYKTGQKLIVNSSIEGMFKEIISNQLVISTQNSIDQKIPISSIKTISVPSKTSFTKGFLVGAGIIIVPITMLSIGNPEAHYGIVFASIATPIMAVLGGLTSYILPNERLYSIRRDEWEIVND